MSSTEREVFIRFLARIAKEGLLILLVGFCAFLLLSLATFDARDPGWSHLGYGGGVENAAGYSGAWLADFCFSMLGYLSFVVPLMFGYRAVMFLRRRGQGLEVMLPYLFLRTLGAALLLLAGAALASLHVARGWFELPFSAGGMVGLSLADLSVNLFSLPGGTLVLMVVLLLGITLFTDLSWTVLADRIGQALLAVWEKRAGLGRGFSPRPRFASEEKSASVSLADKPCDPPAVNSGNRQKEPGERWEPELQALDTLDLGAATDDAPWSEDALSAIDDQGGSDDKPAGSELKIVPLSEAHQTKLDGDHVPDTRPATRRAPTPPPAKRSLPDLSLLDPAESKKALGYSAEQLESMSRLLEAKLKDFGVVAEVVEVNPGPVITRFEIQPAPGVKVSKISNLAKDLARSMAVLSVRVVEVIAGKSVVGIEIPNESREVVRLSEVLDSNAYGKASAKLSLALGNDIAGNPVVVNLAKMPHLLVAGTTGSGKSVGVNAMLLSLLFKATPDEVRLMMVDPKMLELSIYDGIPHLLTPVITDMKEAATGLRWCVGEMERRYKLMAKLGVRNLAGFNDKLREARAAGEPIFDPLWNPEEEGLEPGAPAPELEPLPYIVVVVDEFADMMMIVGKKVEELIARIAQKARAAGIHLILATQRPSVDVITGLIKANVPTRIAFQVSSKIDSRTILDQSGAENLLGYGDMLYLPAGSSMPVRVHGAFVADEEVHRVVEAWKAWGPAEFVEEILQGAVDGDYTQGSTGGLFEEEDDPLYDEAVAFVTQSRRASISSVQRKLKIGYNRAARLVESMEAAGVVSEAAHNGSREVLAPPPVEA
nr:DNA translocase FtsK [Motiliproteus sp. SC1-56]